ncbi:MAG: disulfide reductase [Candidatus Lokiarchaeota archaeon]|nr:disulfide reductase [Candidatus Lokiarchaeota archaeon]
MRAGKSYLLESKKSWIQTVFLILVDGNSMYKRVMKIMSMPENIEKWLHYCIKCNNCKTVYKKYLPSCPSGEKFLFETYWASGRIKTAKALIEGNLDFNDEVLHGLFACTTCGACEIQCQAPHQEHIIDLIEATRELIVKKLGNPEKKQELLEKYIKDKTRLNPYNEFHSDNSSIKEKYDLEDEAEYVYYIGCTSNYRQKRIRDATLEFFKKIGLNFTVIDEVCCGSPLLRTGQKTIIKNIIEHNLKQIKKTGAKTIITSCAGCFRTLKKDWKKLGIDYDFKVIHTCELVSDLLENKEINLKKIDKVATYHDPCHLGRHMGIYEEPRKILRAIFGKNFIEMETNRENTWCCGAGGGVKIAYADWSLEIAEKRIKDALATEASYLTSTCPFCFRNLQEAIQLNKNEIEMIDIIELVNEMVK